MSSYDVLEATQGTYLDVIAVHEVVGGQHSIHDVVITNHHAVPKLQ